MLPCVSGKAEVAVLCSIVPVRRLRAAFLHLGPICMPKRNTLPDPGMVLMAWEPRLVMLTPMT